MVSRRVEACRACREGEGDREGVRPRLTYDHGRIQGLVRPILAQPCQPRHRLCRLGQGRQGERRLSVSLVVLSFLVHVRHAVRKETAKITAAETPSPNTHALVIMMTRYIFATSEG